MDWIGLEYIYKSIANVIAILTSRKRDLVCILGYRPPNLLHRFQLHEILGGSSTNGNNKKNYIMVPLITHMAFNNEFLDFVICY